MSTQAAENIQAKKPNAAFEEDPPRSATQETHEADALLLNIDGYEGPLDVLLELAQKQKVDLTRISVLQLVRQYLGFMERAKQLNLELAAEYLVMAAWLTYLKSRLLLPQEKNEEEHSAEEMAEALQFQLRRLEAMRKAAEMLSERPQLGRDVFGRGQAGGFDVQTRIRWGAKLYDVLKAYGDINNRNERSHVELPKFRLMSAENAMERLAAMLGRLPRNGMQSVWTTLRSFVDDGIKDTLYARSALASTLTAGLEMVKQGRLEIRQDGLFKPVYMRALTEQIALSDTSQPDTNFAQEEKDAVA